MTIRRAGWGRVARRALLAAVLAAPLFLASRPAAAAPMQLVQNPGFEAGTPDSPTRWGPFFNQPGRVLVSGTAPHTGARSADLCNRDNCEEFLDQAIVVPSTYAMANLRFSYRFDTTEPPENAGFCNDELDVDLLTPGTLDRIQGSFFCNGDAPNGTYKDVAVDVTGALNAYRGQSVVLSIGAYTDSVLLSRMWVDDITLTFEVPVLPSAPVNVTATATGSGGATVTWGAPATGDPPTSYTISPSVGSPVAVSASTRTASFTGLSGPPAAFAVVANNAAGAGAWATSNPVDTAASTPVRDLVSDRQYKLVSSNGATWVDVDPLNLATTWTPPASGQLLLDANIDLWTANPGVNQDVAVVVGGGAFGSGTVVGWKESGGFAGTFSPNAAAVNAAVDVVGGTAYTLKLAWKSNVPAAGKTIFAGAGPIGGGFSPTRLTATFAPAGNPVLLTRRTDQFLLNLNDGVSWTSMSATTATTLVAPIRQTFTASADGTATITGNADLWTWNPQYNQDLGLFVRGGAYGLGQIVAWKESGGFAGTFSPNAALVEARIPVTNGVSYTAELMWKANKPMPADAKISAGAGTAGSYSPTTLTITHQPTASTASRMSATQYRLDGSDGQTWQNLDTPAHDQAPFDVSFVAPANGYVHLIGNTDLWTYVSGYNQDIGIKVTPPPDDAGTAPNGIVAWKESGGFAGTFSPNAAAVEGYYPVLAFQTYTFSLVWKMNKPAAPGISISAGAGGPADFSPTRLDLRFQPQ